MADDEAETGEKKTRGPYRQMLRDGNQLGMALLDDAQRRDITFRKLAERIGVSHFTLTRAAYWNEKTAKALPSVRTLQSIAKYLGYSSVADVQRLMSQPVAPATA